MPGAINCCIKEFCDVTIILSWNIELLYHWYITKFLINFFKISSSRVKRPSVIKSQMRLSAIMENNIHPVISGRYCVKIAVASSLLYNSLREVLTHIFLCRVYLVYMKSMFTTFKFIAFL